MCRIPDSPQDTEPVFEGFQQASGVSKGWRVERDRVAVSEGHSRQGREGGQDLGRRLPRVCRHRGRLSGDVCSVARQSLLVVNVLAIIVFVAIVAIDLTSRRCC